MIFHHKTEHVSFNLTDEARSTLTVASLSCGLSKSDIIEALIRNQIGKPILKHQYEKKTAKTGGTGSFFGGKGKTVTAVVSKSARQVLLEKSKESNMSTGDYMELLIRKEFDDSVA